MPTGRRNKALPVLAVLCLLQAALCHAQTTIDGSVVAVKGGEPVPGAFVYAYDGNSMSGYALADGEGRFSIRIASGKSADRLMASCMGYRNTSISISGNDALYVIRMEEQKLSIKESKVTAQVLEEKGDTLSYTVGAFSDGNERFVGELLQKIPGISVTESGGVLYNGKHINKFYIDGMDLIGSGYGVVTKNLQADRIARVDVYKRHQPIRALEGISQTDAAAVNIILKENARNTWMITGDLVLGAPRLPLFDAKMLLTRFSKTNQDLYLLKGNNIGHDIMKELMQQQYFGRTGVIVMDGTNLDSDFQSPLNPHRTVLPIPQEYWYGNISGMGSFNHLSRLGDDLQVRASVQAASERYDEASVSAEEIRFGDSSSMTISEDRSMADLRHYLSAKVALEKNAAQKYLMDELSFSGQFRDNVSDILGNPRAYHQSYRLPSFKIENDLNSTIRSRSDRAISIKSNTRFVSNSHQSDYTFMSLEAHQNYRQMEFKSSNRISSDVRVRNLKLGLAGGLNLEYQDIDAALTRIPDLGIMRESSLRAVSAEPFASVSGTFFIGETELHASVPVHLHVVSGQGVDGVIAFPTLSPLLNLRRTFSSSFKASASASYTLSRSGIETLLPSYVMTNYRSMAVADSLARNESIRLSATLDYSNNISFLYASLTASYVRSSTEKTASSFYTSDLTFMNYRFLPVTMSSSSLSGKVSKYFGLRAFVMDLSANVSRSNRTQYLQNVLRDYVTDALSAKLSLRTSPVSWFSVEASLEYKNSVVEGGPRNQAYVVEGFVTVNPVKELSIKTSVDYLYENVPGMTVSNVPLVKAEAVWKLKRLSLVADCGNILNCKEFSRTYIDTYRTYTSTTKLFGRQFMLGVRLSL